MSNYNLMYAADFYKVSHKAQYPEDITKVHSTLVARNVNYNDNVSKEKIMSRDGKVVRKNMSNIKTASLKELRAMKERGEIAPPRSNAPEIDMPEGFWDVAQPQEPQSKQAISMRVDPDVLAFFKAQGRGYQTKMNAVLKSYVDAQKTRHTP